MNSFLKAQLMNRYLVVENSTRTERSDIILLWRVLGSENNLYKVLEMEKKLHFREATAIEGSASISL